MKRRPAPTTAGEDRLTHAMTKLKAIAMPEFPGYTEQMELPECLDSSVIKLTHTCQNRQMWYNLKRMGG